MSSEIDFTVYSVGDVFDRKMPEDGAIFEINDNLCQCIIGLTDISDKELHAIEKGHIEITLSYYEGIIFLNIIADGILYFDVPFNMGLYDKFQLENPKNFGYTTIIFLVDNATNRIAAMHAVGFDNDFSKKLYELSKYQWEHKIEDYDKKINDIMKNVSQRELLKHKVACNVFGNNDSLSL